MNSKYQVDEGPVLTLACQGGGVAVDCIALNCWGKHKGNIAIRGVNKQESNQQQ